MPSSTAQVPVPHKIRPKYTLQLLRGQHDMSASIVDAARGPQRGSSWKHQALRAASAEKMHGVQYNTTT
jgi:hypothetical protein